MSLEVIAWVLNDASSCPSHCVGVLIGLANHARPDGTGAYAPQGLLSKYAKKNTRQVRRDLEKLESLGIIRRGNQRLVSHIPADKRPIVWDIVIDRRVVSRVVDVTDPDGVSAPVDNPERPVVQDRPDVHDRPPTTGRTGPAGRTRPAVQDPPDADDRSSTSYKPESKSTPSTTSCAPADADAPQRDTKRTPKPNPLARFDDFWRVYPKKKGKPAAQKAFAKAVTAGADPQAIIDGAIAYALECRMKDPQYIKQPQGWLNDGRWQDEPDRPFAPPVITGPSAAAAAAPPPIAEVLARQARYGAETDDPWTPAANDPFYEPPF